MPEPCSKGSPRNHCPTEGTPLTQGAHGGVAGWHSWSVINATHSIIYAEDADKARTFFRDVLGLANVDAHGGWLIFKLPPSELGIHPGGTSSSPGPPSGHHELYLMCDDIESTMSELESVGVEFTSGIEQAGFGRLTHMRVPGAGEIGLYQPRHLTAYDLDT
jgi:predicted enzyme related to lactoylglutathione lyase